MKQFFLTLIFLGLFAGIVSSQYFLDQNKKKLPIVEPLVFSSSVVKAADLGLDNAAADIAWLSAIQYFGGRVTKEYPRLDDYLFLSAELDPKFSYPYAFGALILPSVEQSDRGIELAKKGINESSPDWKIPYYLATIYHSRSDKTNAAYYFDVAAHTKGAPEGVIKVAASYGSRQDLRQQTETIWQGIYESSNDEVVKERAKNYIIHFELLTFLETAAKEYKDKFGKFPETSDDLVPFILKSVPADPFGFEYKFDETGRAVIK
jgi:hypothetical protein